MKQTQGPDLYGLMAEFETPDALLEATRRAHDAGYRKMDAYSPFPIEGLADALEFKRTWISFVVLGGGISGLVGGLGLQIWTMAIDYPINVGGRPLISWPMFIPVAFETTILAAAIGAVFGMLALNGLPMPYHPVFHVPHFEFASQDRFFLAIESKDPLFDYAETRRFLENLGALGVSDVPN